MGLGGKIYNRSKIFFDTEKVGLVFGRFNGLIENIILGVINETSGKDTFNIIELIKGLITADDNMVEHKGMNSITPVCHTVDVPTLHIVQHQQIIPSGPAQLTCPV